MNEKKQYRKSPWRFLFAAIALLGGFHLIRMLWTRFLILAAGSQTLVATSEVYSVGIIGGADGPTAIFVTGPSWPAWILPCVLLAVGLFGFWRLSRCKRK